MIEVRNIELTCPIINGKYKPIADLSQMIHALQA